MSSRFIRGDGYPIIYRYNSSDVLQATVNMPYVRDDGQNSYIKQFFDPYPDNELLHHPLLSGSLNQDKPQGYLFRCEIKYASISASDLADIYNLILDSLANSGDYLKIKPRSDHDGTNIFFKVVYTSGFNLESQNMWQHNVILPFSGMDLISTSLDMEIPPVTPP